MELTNNLLYDFSQTTIPTDTLDDDYLALPGLFGASVTAMMLAYPALTHVVKMWFVRRWGM